MFILTHLKSGEDELIDDRKILYFNRENDNSMKVVLKNKKVFRVSRLIRWEVVFEKKDARCKTITEGSIVKVDPARILGM